MRGVSSDLVSAALLFGFVAVLVIDVNEAANVTNAARFNASVTNVSIASKNSLDDEDYVPFQGERFDVFDWGLCKNLAKNYYGNMLVSPISIKLALVLLYEGAQGQTAHELAGALELPGGRAATRDRFSSVLRSLQTVRPEYVLDISTRLFFDTSIKPRQRYSAVVKTFYSTDVVVANLTDAEVSLTNINAWVSNVTHGHVKKALTDAEKLKDSIFLVLNALYFKGTWRHPFLKNDTKIGTFYTDVDKSVQVPFMNSAGNYYFSDSPELDAQILRLPYLGQKYAMFIVLPRARMGLQQLTQDINPFILRRHIWLMEDIPVDVSIPKFKFEFTSHLENVLRELGIRDIFDNTASLPGIARAKQMSQRLMVSDFVQKVGIEVNEEGTTAHAVTEVQIGNKISDRVFHVRHPFLFFIEDESTGTVVFVGKVTNPLETIGSIEEPEVPTRFGQTSGPSAGPIANPGKSKG